MALHFILDGYNIIKSDAAGVLTQGSLEEQRKRLVTLLNTARPQGSSRNCLTVVFDGPFESPYFGGSFPRYQDGDVEIIFSEGDTADERIERLVAAHPRPADIVVVTDDKGLRRMLGGSGVKFMAVAELSRRLFKGARPSAGGNDPAVDAQTVEDINRELEERWFK
jgi:predicted RNA-binding protein with PIN domain